MPDEPNNQVPLNEPTTPAQEPVAFGGGSPEQAPLAPAPQKKSRKKLFILSGIIAGALVVLVGGSALAYTTWYQNPQKVVSDAVINAITAKTVSVTGTLNVDADDSTISVNIAGHNSSDANSTVAVKATFASKKDDYSYTLDAEGVYSADGDLYVKVNNAKDLVDSLEKQSGGSTDLGAFSKVIDDINGRWIKISSSDLGDFSDDLKKTQQCFADISKSMENDATFRKTAEQEVQDLYKAHPLFTVGDKVGSRTINGTGSLGYHLIPSDDATAKAFFTGLGDTELGKKVKSCDDSINFDDIVSDEAKDTSTDTSDVQIWVSRFGHQITELSVKSNDSDATKDSFVIDPVFNKNQAVAVPSDAMSLSDLKTEIESAYESYFSSLYGLDTTGSTSSDTLFN